MPAESIMPVCGMCEPPHGRSCSRRYVYVSPVNLRTEVAKSQAFVLPSNNAKGIKAFLVDNHKAIVVRVEHAGKRMRVMRLPLAEVEVD